MKATQGVMYVYAVIIISLLVLAFFWFMFYTAIAPTRTAISTTMTQYDTADPYDAFVLADLFMQNVWLYMLALVVIGLAYWGYQYSQRRGQGYF